MIQWKQRIAGYYSLLWILAKNRHKWTQNLFTIELLWITWGDQHEHKERNLYKFAIAESKVGLKRRKKICGLRKAIDTKRTQICRGSRKVVNTTQKAERTRVRINAKWSFFWKSNSTQNGCTQRKMIADPSADQHNWIEWTRKKWSSCKNFNARKSDLSRSTTVFTQYQLNTMIHKCFAWMTMIWLIDLLSGLEAGLKI